MLFPFLSGARVAVSATSAVVLTVGLVTVPLSKKDFPTETHQIQLRAAIVSAAANSSSFDFGSSATASSSVIPTLAATETREPTPVAATEEENFWTSPLGTVLIAVNFLVLPIWFLLTPITLPLSMFAAAAAVPEEVGGSLGSLLFLAATGIGFLTGPLGVLNYFIMGLESSTTAGASASSRVERAMPLPASATAEATPPTEVAADYVEAIAIDDQTVSTDPRTSARPGARQIGASPRAAAAIGAEALSSSAVGVETDAEVASKAGEQAPQSDADQQSPSSVTDVANGKSNARMHSRR